MKRIRDWPISVKLRLIILTVSLAAVALTSIVWMFYERDVVMGALPPAQLVRARILSSNATAALAFDSPKDAQDIVNSLQADNRVTAAAIFDPSGKLFVRYQNAGAPLRHVTPEATAEGFHYGPGYLDVWTTIAVGNRRLGSLVIERNLRDLDDRLKVIPMIGLGIMVLAGLAAYLLAGILQRIVSEPVLRLSRAASHVTERRDYSLRVTRSSDDEIGQLTESFNAMLATIGSANAETARLYEQVRRHAGELETRVKERTAQLEDANEELDAFSSTVSHDLRGPLRYIDGYAQMILEEQGASLAPQAKDYLERIIDRAARMNGLISVLLEFSRLNRQAINPEPVDLGPLAHEVFADLRAEVPDREVRLKVGPLPPSRADRELIRLVLGNLISNAIKYTKDRNPALVEVGASLLGDRTEYYVRDNGVGFDPARAGKLFMAFERLHDQRQFAGTGVGLATVKRIILRHGGTVRAESVLNGGSTFYFTLPSVRHDA